MRRLSDYGLEMTRGDDERMTVYKRNKDGTLVPFVTGEIVYFTVKMTIYDCEAIIQKVITVFDELGRAVVDIAHLDTAELSYGNYMYDIQLVNTEGSRTTVIPPSTFRLTGEITYA